MAASFPPGPGRAGAEEAAAPTVPDPPGALVVKPSDLTGNGQVTIGTGRAAAITAVGGSNQHTPVNTLFSQPLSAKVTGRDGEPVAGVTVYFRTPYGTGPLGHFVGQVEDAATTDSQGIATTSVHLMANGGRGRHKPWSTTSVRTSR